MLARMRSDIPRFGAGYQSQGLRTGRLTIGRTGARKDFGQSEFLYIFELSNSFFKRINPVSLQLLLRFRVRYKKKHPSTTQLSASYLLKPNLHSKSRIQPNLDLMWRHDQAQFLIQFPVHIYSFDPLILLQETCYDKTCFIECALFWF